jgi:uncharacterized membrane protein
MVFMLLFWGLIIVGLVLGVRWLWGEGRPGMGTGSGDASLEILKRRYALGDYQGGFRPHEAGSRLVGTGGDPSVGGSI